ncbi:hypothetical protein BT93_I0036 [Corymbia citriodora subsp. variegata]|nr:hypothetical protein BT93_I0036 [Corymbia citriodora subsp. variegata]
MAIHHRRPSIRGSPPEPLRSRCLQLASRGSTWGLSCPESVLSALRKYREVRPSTLARKYLCTIALGFGFDARSNDHKIVILYDGNVQRLETRVQIYSLRTDSWRSLECEVPAFCRNTSSVFLNGNLHWLVPKHDDMWWETGYRSIALFDVVNEVFDEMVPSEKFLHVISVSSQAVLSVLNDLLAVCTSREETVGHPETLLCFSVWVMREYGVPDSWTELYCFQTSEQVLGVDGFTRNGDLLLKIDGAKRLSRNPITGQFTNLPLRTHRDFYTVVESLVSP